MPVVDVEERDGIHILRLNRPERLNAFNLELVESLRRYLERARSAEGIVLTGTGKAFSAGDDIYEMYSFKTLGDAENFFQTLKSLIREVIHYPGPIVACLNGFAVGGGAELILLTDYNIAFRDVWLWYPEYRIGVYPPILLAIGPLIFGLKETKKIAFNLEKLDADRAMKLGILDKLVDRDKDIISLGVESVKNMLGIGREGYIYSRRILAMHYEGLIYKVIDTLPDAVMKPRAKELMRLFIEKKLG